MRKVLRSSLVVRPVRPGEEERWDRLMARHHCLGFKKPVREFIKYVALTRRDTVGTALDRVQERFRLRRVVMIGDRGMITNARIDTELRPRGVQWITALRGPTIRKLMNHEGPLQLSLFDEKDLAEIIHPDFPRALEHPSGLGKGSNASQGGSWV